jgi:hypothetical protein
MKFPLIIALLLYVSISFSQSKSFEISVELISEEDTVPLEAATVYLQRVIDSSLVTYALTDNNGKFTLEGKTSDKKVNLFISYEGYQTYFKVIDLNNSIVDLGRIILK